MVSKIFLGVTNVFVMVLVNERFRYARMSKNKGKKKRLATQPTEVELEILEVLWEIGPSPLGLIHEACLASRPSAPGYTTTQKMIQVMRDKGLVEVEDDSKRPLRYRAAEAQEKTQLKLLDDVTQRVFGGSSKNLVMSLLEGSRLSTTELDEVKQLISDAQNNSENLL